MKPWTITRARYTVTATCDRCGESETRRTDNELSRWQRSHECTTERKP